MRQCRCGARQLGRAQPELANRLLCALEVGLQCAFQRGMLIGRRLLCGPPVPARTGGPGRGIGRAAARTVVPGGVKQLGVGQVVGDTTPTRRAGDHPVRHRLARLLRPPCRTRTTLPRLARRAHRQRSPADRRLQTHHPGGRPALRLPRAGLPVRRRAGISRRLPALHLGRRHRRLRRHRILLNLLSSSGR
jgi:hypothetical protein